MTSGEATDPERTGRRIVKLPDAVANQIAAGEVVERPAAVVKELVENALDAQARTIEIQFERGGCSLIRVSDDGSGMSPGDAALSLERHATSKIRSAEDLVRVSSFGFRGEALPSIASVSRFRLRTRQPEAREGVEIEIHGRSGSRQRTCVLSPGTEVIVADLFHNVPARRKFLKTERTEAAHILQVCRLLAVAHPEVGFSLVEDGHEVFRSPPCPDRLERVREIFGKRRARELMLFSAEVNGIRMSGLLGRKEHGRATRSEMITYVNLRPVESRVLNYALIESYHRYLPRGRYPQAFLFLDVSGEEVDVNVHPTKREVRFRNEALMRTSVMQAVLDRLGRDLRPSLEQAEAVEAVSPRDPGVPPEAQAEKPTPALRPEIVPDRRPPFPEPRERPLPTPATAASTPAPDRGGWRYKGCLRNGMGLVESPDGLVILNPRAARERILYERIAASLQGGEIPRQPLLLPPLLEFPPLEASVLGDQTAFFASIGFVVEPFGRNTFRIREVPAWLESAQPETLLEELVGRIRDRGMRPEDRDASGQAVARMAAVREARAFRPADGSDWQRLLAALLDCETPLLDARGRPVFWEIRYGEMARRLMLDGQDRRDSEGL